MNSDPPLQPSPGHPSQHCLRRSLPPPPLSPHWPWEPARPSPNPSPRHRCCNPASPPSPSPAARAAPPPHPHTHRPGAPRPEPHQFDPTRKPVPPKPLLFSLPPPRSAREPRHRAPYARRPTLGGSSEAGTQNAGSIERALRGHPLYAPSRARPEPVRLKRKAKGPAYLSYSRRQYSVHVSPLLA